MLTYQEKRTVNAEELNLKKEQTSYSDLLDALRLALKGTFINNCLSNKNVQKIIFDTLFRSI